MTTTKVYIEVPFFGHHAQLEYDAEASPETAPPTAAVYVNRVLRGHVRVVNSHPTIWEDVVLDPPEDLELVTAEVLGVPSVVANLAEFEVIEQVVGYLWAQLAARLEECLRELTPRSEESEDRKDEYLARSPRDRALRVVRRYAMPHAPSTKDQLAVLITNEIYDVVDRVGEALAVALAAESPEDPSEFVRLMIAQALESWTEADDNG
jgi:hypothetical protein